MDTRDVLKVLKIENFKNITCGHKSRNVPASLITRLLHSITYSCNCHRPHLHDSIAIFLTLISFCVLFSYSKASLKRRTFHVPNLLHFLCNISNTRRSVSSDIQTPRRELKNEADETLFRVFDIASQRNQYFKRYLGSKLAKFYAN